jgi:hypothetical protein
MDAKEAAILASACARRRTVRMFDGAGLSQVEHDLLEMLASNGENSFGIPVDLRLVDAEKYGASSRVIHGTSWYAVGFFPRRRACGVGCALL